MSRQEFWNVIKDDDAKTFEAVGLSSDDTRITNLICEMKKLGMNIRCESFPSDTHQIMIPAFYAKIHYTPEEGLYKRLCFEFERRKQKQRNDNA